MNDALLIFLAAGIFLIVGALNAALSIYTGLILEDIRTLLERNAFLNTEAIDLLRYGITRGYEQGRDDTLRILAREEGVSDCINQNSQ